MIPVNFPGANIVIQKNPGTPDSKAIDGAPAWFGVDKDRYYSFIVAWQPNVDDLKAINEGKPIFVKVYAIEIPSIVLLTLDDNGNPNS